MQNTRLNNLVDLLLERFGRWYNNPWRRMSLIILSWLFGFFLGTAIPTEAGQTAEWDLVGAGILLLLSELVSRFVYGRNRQPINPAVGLSRRSLLAEILNSLKLGLTYSLFIEAFKLAS
jgi:hypothetical protein